MQILNKVVDIFWFLSMLAKNQTFKGKFTHRKECDRSCLFIHSPPVSLIYQAFQSIYNTRGRIVGYQILTRITIRGGKLFMKLRLCLGLYNADSADFSAQLPKIGGRK